ncbi:uncharacterized protein VNE69_11105 [Vairimorpha necatrix]|uniref:Uncharacterized protein n=1 Tax=Vairimorpha necatrix TaxID=6039 RepID=A0AAX4JG62_9MICR
MIKLCLFLDADTFRRYDIKTDTILLHPLNEIRNVIWVDSFFTRSTIRINKSASYLIKVCREIYDGLKNIRKYNERSINYMNVILKFFKEIDVSIDEIEDWERNSLKEKKRKEFIKLKNNRYEIDDVIMKKLEKNIRLKQKEMIKY